jgi:hypothetical protein
LRTHTAGGERFAAHGLDGITIEGREDKLAHEGLDRWMGFADSPERYR